MNHILSVGWKYLSLFSSLLSICSLFCFRNNDSHSPNQVIRSSPKKPYLPYLAHIGSAFQWRISFLINGLHRKIPPWRISPIPFQWHIQSQWNASARGSMCRRMKAGARGRSTRPKHEAGKPLSAFSIHPSSSHQLSLRPSIIFPTTVPSLFRLHHTNLDRASQMYATRRLTDVSSLRNLGCPPASVSI